MILVREEPIALFSAVRIALPGDFRKLPPVFKWNI